MKVTATRKSESVIAVDLAGRKFNITQQEAEQLLIQLLGVTPNATYTESNAITINKAEDEAEARTGTTSDPFAVEPEMPQVAWQPDPRGPKSGLPEFDSVPQFETPDHMGAAREKLAEDIF